MHLRPIRPDDRDRLVAFHSRLSERTVYLRYFAAAPDAVRARPGPAHQRRPRRPGGAGRAARRGPDRGRPVRPDRRRARAPRSPSSSTTRSRAAASARCCWSTSPRPPGSAASSASSPRCSRRTARMVRVFTDAGYTAEYSYDSGVVELSFPIAPTDASRAVAYERERRAESRSIERLLTPRSVAVVGASTDPAKVGHVVFGNLMAYGFQGPVYPVHPEARHVGGVRAYPSVLDVPDDVDLAVVAVPAAAVAGVVEECARKRVRGAGRAVRRLRRARRGRPGAGAGAGHGGPRARHAGGRAELPRRRQRRPRGPAQRDDRAAGARPRPGRLLLPVRRARHRDPGLGGARAASGCPPSSPPATGPTSAATTCSSSGRPTRPPTWCCSTWRASATRASSPGWPGGWPGPSRWSR